MSSLLRFEREVRVARKGPGTGVATGWPLARLRAAIKADAAWARKLDNAIMHGAFESTGDAMLDAIALAESFATPRASDKWRRGDVAFPTCPAVGGAPRTRFRPVDLYRPPRSPSGRSRP